MKLTKRNIIRLGAILGTSSVSGCTSVRRLVSEVRRSENTQKSPEKSESSQVELTAFYDFSEKGDELIERTTNEVKAGGRNLARVQGLNGKALKFNRRSNSVAQLWQGQLDADDYTVSLWFKTAATDAGNRLPLLLVPESMEGESNGETFLDLSLLLNDNSGYGKLNLNMPGQDTGHSLELDGSFSDGRWRFVKFSRKHETELSLGVGTVDRQDYSISNYTQTTTKIEQAPALDHIPILLGGHISEQYPYGFTGLIDNIGFFNGLPSISEANPVQNSVFLRNGAAYAPPLDSHVLRKNNRKRLQEIGPYEVRVTFGSNAITGQFHENRAGAEDRFSGRGYVVSKLPETRVIGGWTGSFETYRTDENYLYTRRKDSDGSIHYLEKPDCSDTDPARFFQLPFLEDSISIDDVKLTLYETKEEQSQSGEPIEIHVYKATSIDAVNNPEKQGLPKNGKFEYKLEITNNGLIRHWNVTADTERGSRTIELEVSRLRGGITKPDWLKEAERIRGKTEQNRCTPGLRHS